MEDPGFVDNGGGGAIGLGWGGGGLNAAFRPPSDSVESIGI